MLDLFPIAAISFGDVYGISGAITYNLVFIVLAVIGLIAAKKRWLGWLLYAIGFIITLISFYGDYKFIAKNYELNHLEGSPIKELLPPGSYALVVFIALAVLFAVLMIIRTRPEKISKKDAELLEKFKRDSGITKQ